MMFFSTIFQKRICRLVNKFNLGMIRTKNHLRVVHNNVDRTYVHTSKIRPIKKKNLVCK